MFKSTEDGSLATQPSSVTRADSMRSAARRNGGLIRKLRNRAAPRSIILVPYCTYCGNQCSFEQIDQVASRQEQFATYRRSNELACILRHLCSCRVASVVHSEEETPFLCVRAAACLSSAVLGTIAWACDGRRRRRLVMAARALVRGALASRCRQREPLAVLVGRLLTLAAPTRAPQPVVRRRGSVEAAQAAQHHRRLHRRVEAAHRAPMPFAADSPHAPRPVAATHSAPH
eukprot:6195887-Pleurochrysis_carterae.AAC.3